MIRLISIAAVFLTAYLYPQQGAGLSFHTGDTEIDLHLGEVNNYASADISVFRKDLVFRFQAGEDDMNFFLIKDRIPPADVYYGYALAYSTGRPVRDMLIMYKEKQGWGSIAKELGIKRGSEQFHRLKNTALKSISKEKMKARKKDYKGNKTQKSSGGKKNKKK